MKSYDSFPHEFDYNNYLYSLEGKGHLPETTVDEAAKKTILAQVLTPELPDGFYLEVGPATSPYFTESPRDFTRLHYVGIDGGKSEYRGHGYDLWLLNKELKAAGKRIPVLPSTPHATFLWGDAQALPFPNADNNPGLHLRETFMRDVLLEPGIHARSVERIFQEQARVLATDGSLIIRETTYDHYHHPFKQNGLSPSFLSLLANLERTGFTKRIVLHGDDPAFPELIQRFPGANDSGIFPIGYYIIVSGAKKRKVPSQKG
jgi:SAM-dependent methyltransferase